MRRFHKPPPAVDHVCVRDGMVRRVLDVRQIRIPCRIDPSLAEYRLRGVPMVVRSVVIGPRELLPKACKTIGVSVALSYLATALAKREGYP